MTITSTYRPVNEDLSRDVEDTPNSDKYECQYNRYWEYGLCTFGVILVLVTASTVLFLIIGVPTIVVKTDKKAQLEKVEDITQSEILQADRFRRYGIAVTEDGQVCTMKSRREVKCINEFHQGVAVRYDTINNPPIEIGNSNQYLILTKSGIIYVIVEGHYSMSSSSYIFGTWKKSELARCDPIQYYQKAYITKNGDLIAKGNPVYPSLRTQIKD